MLFPYFNEIIILFLGLFIGLFTSFVGTAGGSAIAIYLILILGILPSQTVIAGTMLYVSCLPLALFGIREYYVNKSINFYIGNLMILGLIVGIFYGSKYAFVVNKKIGERYGDKIKYGITSAIYIVLALLYMSKMRET
jgi:uncharacterized membrane protein YfcA